MAKDERFLHPLSVYDFTNGKIYVAFRIRNHMIPCTTRWMKTRRKQVLRLASSIRRAFYSGFWEAYAAAGPHRATPRVPMPPREKVERDWGL